MAKKKINLNQNFERDFSANEFLRLIAKLKRQFPEKFLAEFLVKMRKKAGAQADDLTRLVKAWSKNNQSKSSTVVRAIEHLKRLDPKSLKRITRLKNISQIKGMLLEELYNGRIHHLMRSKSGKKAIQKMLKNVDEKDLNKLVYIEGHSILDKGKKALTDGVFAIPHKQVIDGVEKTVWEIKGVVEAKSGAYAAKGLVAANKGVTKLKPVDKRELLREMLDNAPEKVLKELEKLDKTAAALIRKNNATLTEDIILGFDMDIKTVEKLIGNQNLRRETLGSLTEAGQLRKDYERLTPNEGDEFVKVLINGQEELVKLPNPTSKLTFISVIPKDVHRPVIPRDMAHFNHAIDKGTGMKKDELFHLARWLRHNADQFDT